MKNSKPINWVAGTTVVGSLVWLFLRFHPFPPDIDHRLHEAVGEAMAGEAARLIETGTRLIVLVRDTHSFEMPAAEAQLEAFVQTIHKKGLAAPVIRLVKVDPLRPVSVPPGDFFDLLRQTGEKDVVVSFLGPPKLGPDQVSRLGTQRPRVIALCAGSMSDRAELKGLFAQKLLTAALVSRPDAPARTSAGNKQGAFDQMFRWISTANLAELASNETTLR